MRGPELRVPSTPKCECLRNYCAICRAARTKEGSPAATPRALLRSARMTVNDSASGGLPRRARGHSAPDSALGAASRSARRVSANETGVVQAAREAALSAWAWLVRTYATVDPRSLGVCRILLGLLVFADVA